MAKQMVYFNAIKQIGTVTIHYNSKLDGLFVEAVCEDIEKVSKKFVKKIDLKEEPRQYKGLNVYVYPDMKMFNQIFNGVIEKRYYNRRRSLEDLYVVQDSEGNIHIASPRGKSQEKIDALKQILVMRVLGEYIDEKDQQSLDNIVKTVMKNKIKEKEKEEQEAEELEEEEPEIEEEELEELVEAEDEIDEIDDSEIDESAEQETETTSEYSENVGDNVEEIPLKVEDARNWLRVGWMRYLSGKLTKEKHVKYFAEHISKNGVKKLGKLKENKWYEKYNYSKEYAAAMVEYIVKAYGVKRFVAFYENPTDYKHVFGISKISFEHALKGHMYTKYSTPKMESIVKERGERNKNEIDEKLEFEQTKEKMEENI